MAAHVGALLGAEIWLVSSAAGCAVPITAFLLLVMLLVNVAAMTWSGIALQSALHPYLLALALVSPLIARAVAVRLPGRRG